MSTTPQGLSERCEAMFTGFGQAIDWVQGVRRSVRRLDNEADGLVEELRRSRNLCRRLGAAAGRPLSIGVFGMSQAGKSYLISTLAQGANGQLQTLLDGERLDFIDHINPPGGGKEATGLVTRFTRQPNEPPKGYPLELTLFSEADVIKILGNSYFNDFDRERVTFNTEPEHIRQHLAALEKQRQPQPTGGLDEDDMVDLLDYFQKRFGKSMEPLKADFWPTVIELAPRLPAQARGRLLSVLWGEDNTSLTEIYVRLRNALAKLDGARTVYVPLSALVRREGDGYQWSPDSILNVDVLDRLGKDEAEPLSVLPVVDGAVKPESGIPRSLLAALTAELKFVLADPPVANMLEQVDLLDFPGYRGRLAIADLDEIRKDPKLAGTDPVAQLLLRGKVGYLFERYTDDQEMSILIMCTRCDIQIEITTLKPVLDTWVHSTQGEKPADRALRPPGLVWVITQLDKRLMPVPGQSDAALNQLWGSMVHITLLERFGQCDWLQEWADGKPFNNLFLMRKPGFMSAVIETAETDGETVEGDFKPGEKERLARQRSIFVENENVSKHVGNPEEAWDAVLKPNDGGMGRLAQYLSNIAVKESKLGRINEQIQQRTKEIAEHRLGAYFFAEGAGEVEKKKKVAQLMSDAVEQHADSFGELLASLQPASEQLRRLYLRADTTPSATAEGDGAPAAEAPVKRPSLVRLPLARKDAAAESKPAGGASRAFVFAKVVLSEWIKQLRELPGNLEMQRFLGLPAATLQALTDELITGADRQRIEEQLIEVLTPLEEKRTTTRAGIVDQQVLLARGVVDDFVDQLGFVSVPLAERPPSPVDGRRIFEPPPPVPAHALPVLAAEEMPYSGMFVVDWLEAFRSLAVGNAGHSAGREITPEQNAALGEILAVIRGDAAVAAG